MTVVLQPWRVIYYTYVRTSTRNNNSNNTLSDYKLFAIGSKKKCVVVTRSLRLALFSYTDAIDRDSVQRGMRGGEKERESVCVRESERNKEFFSKTSIM